MKLGFNSDLLLQAVERMRAADEVWLVVPVTRRYAPGRHAEHSATLTAPVVVSSPLFYADALLAPGATVPRPDEHDEGAACLLAGG